MSRRTVLPGKTARYTIQVRNPSKIALRSVRVCDDLPAGLAFVSAAPKPKLSSGLYCWTVKRLGAGKRKTFRMTVRALPGAMGRKVNTVIASSPDAESRRATRTVQVPGGRRARRGRHRLNPLLPTTTRGAARPRRG